MRAPLLQGLDVSTLVNEEHIVTVDDGRTIRIIGLDVHDARVDIVKPPRNAGELVRSDVTSGT